MKKNELPQPLSSAKLFAPKFISKLWLEGYFVDDLLTEIAEKATVGTLGLNSDQPGLIKMVRRQTAIRVARQWTGLSSGEINAGLYNPERGGQLPLIQQAVASLSSAWLKNDLTPPDVQVKQVTRRTGLAPGRIIRLVNSFQPEIKNGSGNYVLTIDNSQALKPIISGDYSPTLKDTVNFGLSPKRILKSARYQSRPPGGGPVQRARLQDKNIPGVVSRMALENAKINFLLIGSQQPEFPKNDNDGMLSLGKSGAEFANPDVADVIQYFKEKGGKKWLRGTDEAKFARILQELSEGRETDVLVWNCFDFDWRQNKPGEYPACIINDDVDESIVINNFVRLRETIEYLSLLGSVTPVVLVPTNEANAPVWEYVQTPDEREAVVDSTVAKLRQKFNNAASGLTIEAMRWDDYLISRGIETKAETYSLEGTHVIDKKLSEKRKAQMIKDDQSYFEQFRITVSNQESEKRVPYYYGVYVGEGKAFAEIVKSGRNVILLDLEEFRVGEMTALGAEGNVPIISPLSAKEKLDYYRRRKDLISGKRKNQTQ